MTARSIRVALYLILALTGFVIGPSYASQADQFSSGLIPLQQLVANPQFVDSYKVSPDGKKLAWVASDGSKTQIRVKTIGSDQVSIIQAQPESFIWAADSRLLLLRMDNDGDEKFHIWTADTENPDQALKDLTPFERTTAKVVQVIETDARHIFIQHNRRNVRRFDLYKVDVNTGREELLGTTPGTMGTWLLDGGGGLRGRIVGGEGGRRGYLEIKQDPSDENWKRVLSWDFLDTVKVLGFTSDYRGIWLSSNQGRDKIVLTRVDLASGKEEVVYADPDADLDVEENNVVIGPMSGEPMMAVSEPDYPNIQIFDPNLKKALTPFLSQGPARIYVNSISSDERLATISVYDGAGTRFYLLDLINSRADYLGEDPLSRQRQFTSPIRSIEFKSRDGLTIHGYLTLPRTHKAGTKLPMVVRVHGGPWYRNIWGNTDLRQAANQVQFLANRGYAVLEINYRGSMGYGRKFMEAAIGEFAGAMQNDLLDGVDWAIRQGIADPEKIAIMGTSYGGYAALVGLTQTPEKFACGVAVAATSDLAKLVESLPPYWNMWWWHRYVGNPGNPDDRAIMDAKSPIFKVNAIGRPLLIIHGANDARVNVEQAERMVSALRGSGKQVEYLVQKEEGHVVSGGQTNLQMYRRIEDFLANCLGGRRGM